MESPESLKKMRGEEDRLSDLPEHLLHHIFSSIPTKEVVRSTSLLSKNWRYFWVSLPRLYFVIGEDFFVKNDKRFRCSPESVDRLLRYMRSDSQSFRLLRYMRPDLQSFRLQWWRGAEGRLVKCWIREALNRNVQELDIYLSISGAMFTVPFKVFTSSSSVKVIKIESDHYHCIFVPRHMVLAPYLRAVELINVELPKGDSKGELIFRCPVLEILIMVRCCYKHLKVVNLSANRLKKLEIDNSRAKYHYASIPYLLGHCKFELHTPNLLTFVYKGVVYEDWSIGNLEALIDVDLSLCPTSKSQESNYIKLFEGLKGARTLTLKTSIFSGGSIITASLISELLTSYNNLEKLDLKASIVRGTCVTSLALPLCHCYSIETLVLRILSYNDQRKKEELTLPSCPLNRLKYIVVWGLEGHEDELELLRFLFKSAVNLERLAITGSRLKESEIETGDLLNFQNKLIALSQDFPKVEASFQVL